MLIKFPLDHPGVGPEQPLSQNAQNLPRELGKNPSPDQLDQLAPQISFTSIAVDLV